MDEFDEILLEKNDLDIDTIINDLNPINLNSDQIKQNLYTIKDKNTIQLINRSNCLLNTLEGNPFDGFNYLIDLDLSHNTLPCLPRGVFDQLLNLQTINLSHNFISELEDSVFKNNKQLIIINLSNNLFDKINGCAFDNLNLLQKLDFSYNRIESLLECCIDSESLQEFNLSHNLINDLGTIIFYLLPNLIDLQLNNNQISSLNNTLFKMTTKIENLNFSNNFIRKLDKKTFGHLYNLKQVDFSNNLLETCRNSFDNKPLLSELNLLNNQITNFRTRDFVISKNIRTLKLTIHEPHKLEFLKTLELLSDFELHINTTKEFALNQCALTYINMLKIRKLYIVIQKGKFTPTDIISKFFNLQFLHIEFLEPSDLLGRFSIEFHINRLPKLEHLALINLNKLQIVGNGNIQDNNLTYLDLTGIDNESVEILRNNFEMLEHLNLSFSQVKSISRDLMSTLPYLKYLNMNGTRISVIEDNLFQHNSKLKIIEFKDCEIYRIGENCFRNLKKLKQIDIRGNIQLRITQNLLNGIPKSAIVYFD